MNPFYQTHLTDNSIKNICRTFYDRYADPLTQTVTPQRAGELVQHIYECLGSDAVYAVQDGQHFVDLFSTDPSQGITYMNLEKHFLRFLAGPVQTPEVQTKNLIDSSLRYEQRAQFENELSEAEGRAGSTAVALQLRLGRHQFARLDSDRDGVLSGFEARALVRRILGADNALLHDAEIDMLLEKIDTDKDGRLSAFDFDIYQLRCL